MIILEKRNRLIVWGGKSEQFPSYHEMVFYDFRGNQLRKYGHIGMPSMSRSEINIDESEKYFVIGYFTGNRDLQKGEKDETRELGIFSIKSGKIVKSIQLDSLGIENEDSIKTARNLNWILISGRTGASWEMKVVLLDGKLKVRWEKMYPGKDFRATRVSVVNISNDGLRFYLQEIGKNNRRTKLSYSNLKGQVKLEKREIQENNNN